MKQNTQEWFEARAGMMTGSRIPTLIGINTYQTREQLKREMIREIHGAPKESTGNIATQWGHDHEAEAREAFELETLLTVEQVGFVVSDSSHAFGCSPDGLTDDGSVLEIKCPYNQVLPEIPNESHVVQLRWNMMICGRNNGYLYYWTPKGTRLFPVSAMDMEQQAAVIALAVDFLDELSAEDPAPHVAPRYVERDDNEWLEAAQWYKDMLEAKADIEQQLADAKYQLTALADGDNCVGGGIRLQSITRAGKVNYTKVMADYGIDERALEGYRGKPSTYIRVERVKEGEE